PTRKDLRMNSPDIRQMRGRDRLGSSRRRGTGGGRVIGGRRVIVQISRHQSHCESSDEYPPRTDSQQAIHRVSHHHPLNGLQIPMCLSPPRRFVRSFHRRAIAPLPAGCRLSCSHNAAAIERCAGISMGNGDEVPHRATEAGIRDFGQSELHHPVRCITIGGNKTRSPTGRTMAATFPLNWELDSLLPAPETPEFLREFERYHSGLARLVEQSESLPPIASDTSVAAAWGEFLKEFEVVAALGGDLDAFIGCWAAADAENRLYQQYEAKLASLA